LTATVAATLRKARWRITEPDDWGKGNGPRQLPPRGRLCVVMAITSEPPSHHQQRAIEAACRAAGLHQEDGGVNQTALLMLWNDDLARTHAEVLDVLDRAVAAEENEA
jgi:hypothetical protein